MRLQYFFSTPHIRQYRHAVRQRTRCTLQCAPDFTFLEVIFSGDERDRPSNELRFRDAA